jgi:low temperature requirement protein LtrA
MTDPHHAALTVQSGSTLRRQAGRPARVRNIELFFDLVYVFAVTQLSHSLLADLTVGGAFRTAVLLGMVWLAWVYTTWVTNWLEPELVPTRLMLIALALVSMVLSIGIPDAFGERGLEVGCAYAAMQIGRSAYTVWALRGDGLQRNFQRILCWCLCSGTLAVVGGFGHGNARIALWVAAILVDVLGGIVGFYTPGIGRSHTTDWQVEADHFAERCQAFVLIALGESVVVTGGTFADHHRDAATVAAFLVAFAATAGFWWIYFDRTAEDSARALAEADDPGSVARSAYHLVHPLMIAGIIVTAAADEQLLADPGHPADPALRWLMLGGTALFLLGHAMFKATVWRIMPWTRLVAIVVLAALALLAPYVSALTLGICTAVVVIAVAATGRLAIGVQGASGTGRPSR